MQNVMALGVSIIELKMRQSKLLVLPGLALTSDCAFMLGSVLG
jgi:hypothetical protein